MVAFVGESLANGKFIKCFNDTDSKKLAERVWSHNKPASAAR